jgi:hypothetical protein
MTARWQSSCRDAKACFPFLIVFLSCRLTARGLATQALLFLLHWLVRLVTRTLLRTGLRLIGMLQFAILLILNIVFSFNSLLL